MELTSLIKRFRHTQVEESIKVAETLNNWKEEILNSFIWINNRRISNGRLKVKIITLKRYCLMQMVWLILNVQEIEYYIHKTNMKHTLQKNTKTKLNVQVIQEEHIKRIKNRI